MRNKKIFILILSLVSLTTVVGLVAFSYAWFFQEQIEEMSYEINADGFLIIYFDEDMDYSDSPLRPATAMKDAVKNNLYMDVLKVYDELDETPSYIQEAATVASYAGVLNYLNAEEPSAGNELIITCEARAKLPNGEVVPISIERELNITITIDIIDTLGVQPDIHIPSVGSGEPFTVYEQSLVTVSLSAYIKLPDELCDPAINEGILTIVVNVTYNPAP